MVDKEPTNPKKSNSHKGNSTSLKRKVVWTALTLTLIGSIYTIVGGNVPNQAFAEGQILEPPQVRRSCEQIEGVYQIDVRVIYPAIFFPERQLLFEATLTDADGTPTEMFVDKNEEGTTHGGVEGLMVDLEIGLDPPFQLPENQPFTIQVTESNGFIDTIEVPVIDCPPQEGNTPVGSDVTVQPIPELTITFAKVTKLGNTEATILNSNPGPVLPGINFLRLWNIETTAEYEGPIQICWDYSGMASQIHPYVEHTLKLFHLESGSWQDVTKSLDIGSNKLCGEVASFSNFAIGITPMRIEGFYSPVDMNDIVNTVKSGQTVPLKFEVFAGQQEITSTDAIKSFTQGKISCSSISNEPTDVIEVTTTGKTELRYDESSGQYVQNWKTPSKQPNTCWKVTLTTADDSKISAYFKLT